MEENDTNINMLTKKEGDQGLSESSSTVKNLIRDIFQESSDGDYRVLIRNSYSIPKLLEYLKESNPANLSEKIELINFITRNFCEVPQNAEIFSKFYLSVKNPTSHSNKWAIFNILIDLFFRDLNQLVDIVDNTNFKENISNEEKVFSENLDVSILECLEVLINNINLKKEVMEFVYQKLSVYNRLLSKYPNDKTLLSKKIVNKFKDLLKILYGERFNISKPYNYFYFSGTGFLKVLEKSLLETKIKISQGCVISFWFKPEGNLSELKNSNLECDLFCIKFNTKDKQKLQLSLVNNKLLIKNLSENDFVYEFPNGEWSHLSLIIRPKSFIRSTEFILITDKFITNYSVPHFNCDCEIIDFTFFPNFVGQATSIMFLNKCVSEEYVKLLRQMPYGIYKEKILQKFMKCAYNKYLTNSEKKVSNLPYTAKDSEGIANLIESMKFCYTPFRHSNSQSINKNLSGKIIYDLCGKYDAGFSNYNFINGVHSFYSYQKNIFFLGGINNLIPLVEMIVVHGDLLDNSALQNILELIYVILNYRKKNMNDAVNKNFFQMLSLFIEKFPNELFQDNILSILLTLGRSLFAFVDECKLSIIYFEYILLNEKIFTKFSIHLQSELWRSLYQFYVSDVSQIKSFMKMSKVCLVLRYYDINRYH